MARTIEIISRHTGKINFKCKGEQRSVVFEDKGNIGVAMVDNDEAEVFLRVGKPDYWKEAAVEVKAATKQEPAKEPAKKDETGKGEGEAGKGEGEAGKGAGDDKKDEVVTKRHHSAVIADIKVAETPEAVDALIVGEERPSVLSAADIRKEELTTPA
jgi:hypothetical protein